MAPQWRHYETWLSRRSRLSAENISQPSPHTPCAAVARAKVHFSYNQAWMQGDLLFEAETPLGFRVRVDKARWELIISEKHPAMKGRESDVKSALETPNEVRQSKSDARFCYFTKSKV